MYDARAANPLGIDPRPPSLRRNSRRHIHSHHYSDRCGLFVISPSYDIAHSCSSSCGKGIYPTIVLVLVALEQSLNYEAYWPGSISASVNTHGDVTQSQGVRITTLGRLSLDGSECNVYFPEERAEGEEQLARDEQAGRKDKTDRPSSS